MRLIMQQITTIIIKIYIYKQIKEPVSKVDCQVQCQLMSETRRNLRCISPGLGIYPVFKREIEKRNLRKPYIQLLIYFAFNAL